MTEILKNKVALITGAAQGIGLGTARLFAKEGAAVAMMDRNLPALAAAVESIRSEGGEAIAVPGDISVERDVQGAVDETVAKFGRIDILVANAGVNPGNSILNISLQEWRETIDVNLTGTFLSLQRAGRVMAKQGGGKVVIIASVDGLIVVPGEAHYGATKAALIHLTRVAAVELVRYGIYVNAISPGWVYTDLTKATLDQPDQRDYWYSHIPAHRVATVDEIAQAALFLSSEQSGKFIVGANLVVDGGASALMNGMTSPWGIENT